MNSKIIGILGLGIFGQTVATELSKYGTEVIAVDSREDRVHAVADIVTNAAIGDFTDIDLLRNIGIPNCDIVIIATGTNLESAVLSVMHLKKLGIPQIIAKARNAIFEEVLYEIGVTSVISPERDSGHRLATKILRNHIDEVLRLDDDTSLIEFEIPESWVGQTLQSLDLRRKYEMNLIGMREDRGEPMQTIAANEPLEDDIILVGIASSHVFERYDYLGYF
ncbi:potassium transporter Trk [Suicoccus acidiformans]|uniref:Potassium transporter Trk n=1 Tax=Suicoccus acidiformans TaxID=2036206 RepID=A0A347WHV9_9LACT|nr:TrkA family potassium uptake protein [Suicoccus acidiformans]AXY24666.1 potassium transporter Trk [Suicoccus acidiformans]